MLLVRTRIGPSTIHGIGVFAEERIKKGQSIWIFDSRIDARVPISDLPTFPAPMQAFLRKHGYEEMHEGVHTIVLCGDHARHVNHSDEPNVIDGETDVAARDIEPGEEITCNYYTFDLDAERKLSQRRSARTPRKSGSVLV
jgi:hypothetical protein